MYAPFQFNTTEKGMRYVLFHDSGEEIVSSHWHKEIEIAYSVKGSTKMAIDKEAYILNEGDMIIVNSGDAHMYFTSEKHERIVIIFDLSILNGVESSSSTITDLNKRLAANFKSSYEFSKEDREELSRIIMELDKLNSYSGFGRDLLIRSLMFKLLVICASDRNIHSTADVEIVDNNKSMNRLRLVLDYVENNYSHPMMLSEIAEVAGIAPAYFSRWFQNYMGTTFTSYLQSFRVGKAQKLLVSDTDQSIPLIAEEVGFSSIKTFNRVFKEMTGKTPSGFKKTKFEN